MANSWSGQPKLSSNVKIQNFLETLRAANSQSSTETEGKPNPFLEFQQRKEIEKKRIAEFQNSRISEWNRVFSAKEREIEKRIEHLKIKLSQLAKQQKNADPKIIQAVEAPIEKAGEYHISYFEHLQEELYLLSLNPSHTRGWLEMYRQRSKKQGAYWNHAKTKGNSYTQSNERSVATSIG